MGIGQFLERVDVHVWHPRGLHLHRLVNLAVDKLLQLHGKENRGTLVNPFGSNLDLAPGHLYYPLHHSEAKSYSIAVHRGCAMHFTEASEDFWNLLTRYSGPLVTHMDHHVACL